MLVNINLIMEGHMLQKQKLYTPQEYILIGMIFLLIGVAAISVADGRLLDAFLASLIPNRSIMDRIQGIAAGFSIPISCASIFFNVRGLVMLRSQCSHC
jgi:hypothetical protein